MLTITTCRPEGRPNRWVATLTEDHPDLLLRRENGWVAGETVEYGDTEEDLIARLSTRGYRRDESGRWSFRLPAHLRADVVPYCDPDGIDRLGPV